MNRKHNMPQNWKKYKLGELGKVITGNTPPKAKPEYYGEELLFVTPSDFIGNRKFIDETARLLSYEGHVNYKKKVLPPESLMVTCIGSQMGKVAMSHFYAFTNQQLNSIVPLEELVEPHFVYYKLSSMREDLRTIAGGGSTMPILNKTDFSNIEISIPNLHEQKSIASILSALDDKIELNLQMNKTLEEMAMALYKHWFVDFGPFQEGEFVESELGMIPKGWEVKRVDAIADIIDPHPSHRAPKAIKEGFPFAGIGDIDEFGNINRSKARIIGEEAVLQQESSYKIDEFSIGFGRVGTVGKVIRLRPQEYRYALSPTMAVINSKSIEFNELTYCIVNSKSFNRQVDNNLTGSTRPTIGIQTLRSLLICLPSNEKVIKRSIF